MFQCLKCSTTGEKGEIVEFDSRADWMAHMKAHKDGKPLPMPIKQPPKPPVPPAVQEEKPTTLPAATPMPIQLMYVYTGQCPVCLRPVDTLDVVVEEKLTMVAYCTACKKQCSSKQVIPVSEQFKSKK